MNCHTPKTLHKRYNLLLLVFLTSHGCYDIVLILLHKDMKKSQRRSQGWNTNSELQNPCFVLSEKIEWKSVTEIRIYIYVQRERKRVKSVWLWMFFFFFLADCLVVNLITYKTRQPINNVFEKSATMFAI